MQHILRKVRRGFLRDTHFNRLQGEAEVDGATLQLLDYTLTIARFVLIGAWILVSHAESHCAVEQDGNFARCGRHRLRFSNARSQPPLERTERRLCAAHGRCHQPQLAGHTAIALAGM